MLDLSQQRTPDSDLTHINRDAAALLREVWQSFPKTMPNLITEPEEEPDER